MTRRNRLGFHWQLAFILGALGAAGGASGAAETGAENLQKLTFNTAQGIVLNPGKGWVIYGSTPQGRSRDALDVCSSAYNRFNWCAIEPAEGVYNWAPIDEQLAAWHEAGKQFGFGVMCESYHANKMTYVTPKWVFDAGVPSIEYTAVNETRRIAIKEWDHPVFLEKLAAFVLALGQRYDGDPRVSLIDIRSYGQWGEGHLGHMQKSGGVSISQEGMQKHIQIHLEAFKKTRVFIPWGVKELDPVYDWAVEQGVGIRRDGVLGNSNGSEAIRCQGKVPAFGEWYYNYSRHRLNDGQRYAWGDQLEERISADTTRGMFTYQNLGQYDMGDKFVKNHRPFIELLSNRMGYHFLLNELLLPKRIAAGAQFEASFTWENKGLANIFIPCAVRSALIGPGEIVTAKFDHENTRPGDWAPAEPRQISEKIAFAVPAGTYKFAVGFFSDPAAENPDISLGNETERLTGWHILGTLDVTEAK